MSGCGIAGPEQRSEREAMLEHERDRLLRSKEALVREVRRLGDRLAEVSWENARYREIERDRKGRES